MNADVETIQRHPIRGALWGLLLGIGITMTLLGRQIISLGTWAPVMTLLLGIPLGVAWSWFAPPKGPKGGEGSDAPDVMSAAGQPAGSDDEG